MLPAAFHNLIDCKLPQAVNCHVPPGSLTWPILTKAGPRSVSISRRRCACRGVRVLQSPPRLESRVCTSHFEMAYPAQIDAVAAGSIACVKAAHNKQTPGQHLSFPSGACRLATAADIERRLTYADGALCDQHRPRRPESAIPIWIVLLLLQPGSFYC